jgi:hypothetical protein
MGGIFGESELVSVRKLKNLSLRGAFCRSLFFRLAITPGVTAEIASSHKTLLAMIEQVVFSDKHELVIYYFKMAGFPGFLINRNA